MSNVRDSPPVSSVESWNIRPGELDALKKKFMTKTEGQKPQKQHRKSRRHKKSRCTRI